MKQKFIYYPDCKTSRDSGIELCPVCSTDGEKRYELRYMHFTGVHHIWDRWTTKWLDTADIVDVLNKAN